VDIRQCNEHPCPCGHWNLPVLKVIKQGIKYYLPSI
jgi:hypothetical protein